MNYKITLNGQTWYEVSKDALDELLKDQDVNGWVDLSDKRQRVHVTFDTLREAKGQPLPVSEGLPETLFGLPVVVSDDVPTLKPGGIILGTPGKPFQSKAVRALNDGRVQR